MLMPYTLYSFKVTKIFFENTYSTQRRQARVVDIIYFTVLELVLACKEICYKPSIHVSVFSLIMGHIRQVAQQ